MRKAHFRTVVIAALVASAGGPAFAADALPFVGTWRCAEATVRVTDTVYDNGAEALPIAEVRKGSDGAYRLLFADDTSITLGSFKLAAMQRISDDSTNTTCRRLGLKATRGGRAG